MTVEELISLLEGEDPDAEVRFAWQPSWSMESTLAERVVPHPADPQDADGLAYLYLVEDEHLGYLPGAVARELGWESVTD